MEESVLSADTPVGHPTPTAQPGLPLVSDASTDASSLTQILSALEADGAEDIVAIDLAGKSAEADHMVIASGRSTRHVSALSEKLIETLKETLGRRARSEGKANADWVLIDAGDVIVHIFRPEVREFYQLEKMWMPALDKTARPA
ncbi:MAG: ribosome silencing factor [Pseudomonadota bacterium]